MVDEARLGHLNLIEFSRESARWGVGGKVQENDGVVLFAAGTWLPVLANGAFRLDERVPAASVVAQADEFFGSLGRGYTVMTRTGGVDDDLAATCGDAGFTEFGDPSPEMVCRQRVEQRAAPDGVRLEWVTTVDALNDFAAVNADAYATYGMPADVLPDIFSRPERVLDSPHIVSVVAYDGDAPLAAAMTLLSHGIAGVYWVGTVDAGRRRGLGELVTAAVTNAAFDRGALCNTLQASVMGEPIYRRMGYEELYRYRSFVRFEQPS